MASHKKYTLPPGTVNPLFGSGTTMTIMDDYQAFILEFYNKKTHKFYGYLDERYTNHQNIFTKNLEESFKSTQKWHLEGIANQFLFNIFNEGKHYRTSFFKKDDERLMMAKQIYNKYYSGVEHQSEIEYRILEYDIEVRRLKINKLKLKIN